MLVLVGVGLQEQLADIATTEVRNARLVPKYSAKVRRALGLLPRSAAHTRWPGVGCPHKVAEGRLPARGGRTHSTTSLATPRSLQGVALAHLCKVRSSSQVATRPTGTPTDNKRLVLPTRPPTGFAHKGRPHTSWPHGHHRPQREIKFQV